MKLKDTLKKKKKQTILDCLLIYLILSSSWKWKSVSCVWLFATPWTVNFPGQNIGMGSLSLLQGIFPTQGSNPHLLCWQAGSLPLASSGKPPKKNIAIKRLVHHTWWPNIPVYLGLSWISCRKLHTPGNSSLLGKQMQPVTLHTRFFPYKTENTFDWTPS